MEQSPSESISRRADHTAAQTGGVPVFDSRADYVTPAQRRKRDSDRGDAILDFTVNPLTGQAKLRTRLSRLMPPENVVMPVGVLGAVIATILGNLVAGIMLFTGTAAILVIRHLLTVASWRNLARLGMLLPLIQAAAAQRRAEEETCCTNNDPADGAHPSPRAPRDESSPEPHDRPRRCRGETDR